MSMLSALSLYSPRVDSQNNMQNQEQSKKTTSPDIQSSPFRYRAKDNIEIFFKKILKELGIPSKEILDTFKALPQTSAWHSDNKQYTDYFNALGTAITTLIEAQTTYQVPPELILTKLGNLTDIKFCTASLCGNFSSVRSFEKRVSTN